MKNISTRVSCAVEFLTRGYKLINELNGPQGNSCVLKLVWGLQKLVRILETKVPLLKVVHLLKKLIKKYIFKVIKLTLKTQISRN